MDVELELNDKTPLTIGSFLIKESDKPLVGREVRTLFTTNLEKKVWASYSSLTMLIPRRLRGIPRIVTNFRHLNNRWLKLNANMCNMRYHPNVRSVLNRSIIS